MCSNWRLPFTGRPCNAQQPGSRPSSGMMATRSSSRVPCKCILSIHVRDNLKACVVFLVLFFSPVICLCAFCFLAARRKLIPLCLRQPLGPSVCLLVLFFLASLLVLLDIIILVDIILLLLLLLHDINRLILLRLLLIILLLFFSSFFFFLLRCASAAQLCPKFASLV